MKSRQPTYDEVFTIEHLYESMNKCRTGVKWKGTVQNYTNHAITNLFATHRALQHRNVKTGHFFHFTIMERGKVRNIKSVHISERVIQRCFCDYCLVPILTRKFIYDNAACIKNKGMHFALRRMKRYLHRFWMKHGLDGYILQFDFHHYFDTIPHDKLIAMVSREIHDKDLQNLYAQLVNDFEGDRGLGLGSQISQISALFYPHGIDNRFTFDKRVFAYARYMDDGYLIAQSREVLEECLQTLRKMSEDLGISLNEKKTHIRRLSHPFEFLKARIRLHPNGRIVVKPNRKNVTRNRRKLKLLFEKKWRGEVESESVDMVFRTSFGNLKNFDAYHTRQNYLNLYNSLLNQKGGKNNEIHRR